MENCIETNSLSFQYSGSKKVLDDISIQVPKGSIYGFLGPNGAGKSTTMGLITGILPEQNNAIKLFGQPLKEQLPQAFSRIGALVESPALYLHLSGYNNLRYVAQLKNIPEEKIPAALELVDLAKDGHRKAKQYSLGMKQRLAIAMALLSEPELLLLDEPVNGLDPMGIVEIRKLLLKLNKENGVTIFVSSHLLSEIEKMCSHVAIIDQGILKFEGTMTELAGKKAGCEVQITVNSAKDWTASHDKVRLINGNQITVQLENKEAIPAYIRQLTQQGADIYEVKILDGLEEWFMQLTNNS